MDAGSAPSRRRRRSSVPAASEPTCRPYNRLQVAGRSLRVVAAWHGCAARPGRRVQRAMSPRVVAGALVAALLVATSAAFVVTEKLKLTRNPIVGPTVDKVFSPVCDCSTASAVIRFRLRRADRVSVEIVDGDGDVVRELARSRPQGRAARRRTSGTGGTATAASSARATYRPRVHLDEQRRTIVMPNRIRVDTTPPRVISFTARPLIISPGPRRAVRSREDPVPGQRARGRGAVRRRHAGAPQARYADRAGRWTGSAIAGGEPLPEGLHTLRLVARDVAGNLGPRSGSRTVRIRFLALGRNARRGDDPGSASRSSRSLRRGRSAGGSADARASRARDGPARRAARARGGTCSRSTRTGT